MSSGQIGIPVTLSAPLLIGIPDVDEAGYLTSSQLQVLLQRISDRHSDILGCGWETMHANQAYWVISRIKVEILRRPMVHDELTILTWPNPAGVTGVDRQYRITDSHGQVVICAMAKWTIVEGNSQRPIRATEFPLLDTSLPYVTEKIWPAGFDRFVVPLSDADAFVTRLIQNVDIDANGHVNNTRYIAFAEEAAVTVFGNEVPRSRFQIHYLAPLYAGETITLRLHQEGSAVLILGTVLRNAESIRTFQGLLE